MSMSSSGPTSGQAICGVDTSPAGPVRVAKHALTAQQALDLLAFLRGHEQLLTDFAAEARDILEEHSIPDGDTSDTGGFSECN
jgi:hypothetical protein